MSLTLVPDTATSYGFIRTRSGPVSSAQPPQFDLSDGSSDNEE
jgi:hypothetical protein